MWSRSCSTLQCEERNVKKVSTRLFNIWMRRSTVRMSNLTWSIFEHSEKKESVSVENFRLSGEFDYGWGCLKCSASFVGLSDKVRILKYDQLTIYFDWDINISIHTNLTTVKPRWLITARIRSPHDFDYEHSIMILSACLTLSNVNNYLCYRPCRCWCRASDREWVELQKSNWIFLIIIGVSRYKFRPDRSLIFSKGNPNRKWIHVTLN